MEILVVLSSQKHNLANWLVLFHGDLAVKAFSSLKCTLVCLSTTISLLVLLELHITYK